LYPAHALIEEVDALGGAARAIERGFFQEAIARSAYEIQKAQESGELCLDGSAPHNPDDSMRRLAELPGIGPWTAHYIAMRALRWPDAFPKEDVAVRNNLGGVTAKQAEALSQACRPWRSTCRPRRRRR